MSQIVPFSFEGLAVRVVVVDGQQHFVGKDVCDALGYADHTNAMKQHCRGVVKRHPIADSLGRLQETRILLESDVMRLIVGSSLPAAQRFEAWVFEEVLPSVRQTGGYLMEGASLESLPPALAKQIGGIIKAVVGKQVADALTFALPQLVEGVLARQSIGIRHGRTSGQLWGDWGLPKLKNGSQFLSRLLCVLDCTDSRAEVGGIPSKMFDPDKVAKHKDVLEPACWRYYRERTGQRGLGFGDSA